MPIEIGILGPFQVLIDGLMLRLSGRRKILLAALVVNIGVPVSFESIAAILWDSHPPKTYRQQIYKNVCALRELLGNSAVITEEEGYRLEPSLFRIDSQQFDEAVREARRYRSARRHAEAVEMFRLALSMWRGPALNAMDSAHLRPVADLLDEQRVTALEECIELELSLDRQAEVVDELSSLHIFYPYRERIAGYFMLALCRCGRQTEAVDTYQQLRIRMANEFGVEPAAHLVQLFESILRQSDGLEASALSADVVGRAGQGTGPLDAGDDMQADSRLVDGLGVEPSPRLRNADQTVGSTVHPVPHQLPADLTRFAGRAHHLAELDALLDRQGVAVVITAIAGAAGVGKTALAVHWAHRVSEHFPDGQLYLNLRGYDDAPAIAPDEALSQFLRTLGVEPQQIPREITEQASLYRTLLAGRRMLILLDNAASEEQVRPLLPGSPGCTVVVTSRNDLRGLVALADADLLQLDVLEPDEAHALVAKILGADRAVSEPHAVAELARLCGYLPLAVRVAVANIARRRGPIADAVADMASDDRLATLVIDRREVVTAAFDLSYQVLPSDEARLFRLLGLLPRSDFTVHAAAALMGEPVARAAMYVTALVSASLVEPHTSGRFRLHDLLHLYARDRVQDDERDAARRRLLEHYLHTTDAAVDILVPGKSRQLREQSDAVVREFVSPDAAQSWLDDELESVTTSALWCSENGLPGFGWQLADALRRYLWLRSLPDLLVNISEAGLSAAQREDDPLGQATMHGALGFAHLALDPKRSIDHLVAGHDLFRRLDNQEGQFSALHNLGVSHLLLGRSAEALDFYHQAFDQAGNAHEQAIVLSMLGKVLSNMGRLTVALDNLEHAFRCLGENINESAVVPTVVWAGEVLRELGFVERARNAHEHACRLVSAPTAIEWRLIALAGQAHLERDTGATARAFSLARQLKKLATECSAPHYLLAAHEVLGQLHLHLGRHNEATAELERGLSLAQSIGSVHLETTLMINIARASLGSDVRVAARLAEEAAGLARARQFGVLHGRALTTLAYVHTGQTSRSLAERAYEIQSETGNNLGKAEALLLLGLHGGPDADIRLARGQAIIDRYTGNRDHVPAGTLGNAQFGPHHQPCPHCAP